MKVLVIRFSSIGDIVLTSPVVRCLKKQLGAEVHFLTKDRFAGILQPNPYIDRVHTLGQQPMAELISALRAEKFDRVVDLHRNLRTLRVKWALRRPARSFRKLNFEKWLRVRLGINRLPDLHIVDRYLGAVHNLGVRYDQEGLDYFIPPGDEVDLPHRPFVAVAIGATHATKRMPREQIAAFCRRLTTHIALLGGEEDRLTGEWIAAEVGAERCTNFCGRLRLGQSADVVRQAAVVVAPDTGLMHIAAAFRKPLVSVWGNTIPEFGMYPFYPTGQINYSVLEVKGLSCRPCSKLGYPACPKGHFRCMREITPEAVVREVTRYEGDERL